MQREPHTAWSRGAAEAVGVLGGTSFVGQRLLARLHGNGLREPGPSATDHPATPVFAFSRRPALPVGTNAAGGCMWHRLPVSPGAWHASIPRWITVCPLWSVAEHFPLLNASGARRLVALSSTSRFTKRDSAAAADRMLAARLAAAEEEVLDRTRALGIVATILRPTLIYDGIHDRNVTAIANVIRRFGVYPVAGDATGLRQPLHADDVAAACEAALGRDGLRDAYEISGGETLPYHEMVRRIFAWLGRPPRLVSIPLPLVRTALPLARLLPPLAPLAAMAARMNEDLVFDHGDAARDFGFQPRSFALPMGRDSNHAATVPR